MRGRNQGAHAANLADNLRQGFSKKYKIRYLERIVMQTRFNLNELEEFCSFLKQEYGLSFLPEKYQQIENRILPIMQQFNLRTLGDIILSSKKDIILRRELQNALTTNETWFFRHPAHFKILSRHILPQLQSQIEKSGDNRIRIWSAGCSNGAETFSILISLLEAIKQPQKFNITIVGSDIATDAISQARKGRYSHVELRLVERRILEKYFFQCNEEYFCIKPEYQKMVDFESLNLLETWPARKYDVIFCRNVMIYFGDEHRQKITEKFFNALNENGYYLTSANESIHWKTETGVKKLFLENEYVYQKTSQIERLRLYKFSTPSDLLRALNLLNQIGMSYGLEQTDQNHSLAPKRAISLSQKDSSRADELFLLSSIKVTSNRPFQK